MITVRDYPRRSWRVAAAAAAGFAVMALPGCQAVSQSAAGNGPGCPPLPELSYDLYPFSTAAGADKIRVSPPGSVTDSSGEDTEYFSITACYGPVKWSVSGPSYVRWNATSGTLKTGQQVKVVAKLNHPDTNISVTVNPGDYVLTFSYSVS